MNITVLAAHLSPQVQKCPLPPRKRDATPSHCACTDCAHFSEDAVEQVSCRVVTVMTRAWSVSPMVQVQDCTCNTHAQARAHTRARRHSQHGSHDRNAWTQESHAECESKLPYCCEYAAAVTRRRNRHARKYATPLAASGNARSLSPRSPNSPHHLKTPWSRYHVVRVVTVMSIIEAMAWFASSPAVSGATPSHACACDHMHASAHIQNTLATEVRRKPGMRW